MMSRIVRMLAALIAALASAIVLQRASTVLMLGGEVTYESQSDAAATPLNGAVLWLVIVVAATCLAGSLLTLWKDARGR